MLKNRYLFAFICISIGTMVAPQAMASVCLGYVNGACVFYSGSVSCDNIDVAMSGKLPSNPTFITCSIAGPTADAIPGVVFCVSKDGKVSAGINGTLAAKSFTSSRVPFTLDNKGKASGIKAHAGANQGQLTKLNHYCPAKQTAIDFVPSEMNTTIQVVDTKGNKIPNNTTSFSCTLPNPGTLGWDSKTKSPDRREYTCTKQ